MATPSLKASSLRERITIQSEVQVADGGGGFTVTWQDHVDTRAAFDVRPSRGTLEKIENGGTRSTFEIVVYVRAFAETKAIQAGWRMIDKATGETYRVNQVPRPVEDLRAFVFFKATLNQPS